MRSQDYCAAAQTITIAEIAQSLQIEREYLGELENGHDRYSWLGRSISESVEVTRREIARREAQLEAAR